MTYDFIICVATNSSYRMKIFINSINQTIDRDKIFLVIVDTGQSPIDQSILKDIDLKFHYTFICQEEKILYAEVMRLKVSTCFPFCNENTIYWNADDDYVFNPYWFQVANLLMTEHAEINYLSLLKVPRAFNETLVNFSGFNLIKAHSCMGGTFCTRFYQFYHVISKYFDLHGTNNMFDQKYWMLLRDIVGVGDNVYTLYDFSLVQQCNLISSYIEQKGSKREHQYGLDFDPYGNPFYIVGE